MDLNLKNKIVVVSGSAGRKAVLEKQLLTELQMKVRFQFWLTEMQEVSLTRKLSKKEE